MCLHNIHKYTFHHTNTPTYPTEMMHTPTPIFYDTYDNVCMCTYTQNNMFVYVLLVCSMIISPHNTCIWRRGLTVQAGEVTASAWMDRKMVTVMSTNSQPSAAGTVLRKQKDGTHIHVPCPESIISYNKFMGGVDRGDQLRGYYSCRSKRRKFYKYIFFFLLDVAITNAYILTSHYSPSHSFKNIKSFRLQLAKELIGEYCSRRRRGRGGTVIRPLPFRHYPIRIDDGKPGPRYPRGPCAFHNDVHHRRVLSSWFCRECGKWLCHNGDPSSDCFMQWHTRHLI